MLERNGPWPLDERPGQQPWTPLSRPDMPLAFPMTIQHDAAAAPMVMVSPVAGVETAARRRGRSILTPVQWRSISGSLALSPREFQIVQAMFDDLKESAMATELGISAHTVHSHIERLYRKLGVVSRCELVVRAFAEHLALRDAGG